MNVMARLKTLLHQGPPTRCARVGQGAGATARAQAQRHARRPEEDGGAGPGSLQGSWSWYVAPFVLVRKWEVVMLKRLVRLLLGHKWVKTAHAVSDTSDGYFLRCRRCLREDQGDSSGADCARTARAWGGWPQ